MDAALASTLGCVAWRDRMLGGPKPCFRHVRVGTGESNNQALEWSWSTSCKSRCGRGVVEMRSRFWLSEPSQSTYKPSAKASEFPSACLARSGTKKGRACAGRDQTCKERGARSWDCWLTEAAPQVMTQLRHSSPSLPACHQAISAVIMYCPAAAAANNDDSNTITGINQPTTACAITRAAACTDWGVG